MTDRAWTGEKTLEQQIEEALEAGATMIQLREKHLSDEEFLEEAKKVKAITERFGVPLIINDNVEVAIRSGADGVHVGQSDMEAGNVRALIGEDKILGVTAKTVEQAKLAESRGADYLGVGTVFPTSTKPDALGITMDTLKEICHAVSIPAVAIGGITKDNIWMFEGTGAAGVALVSAIFGQKDIREATKDMKERARKVKIRRRKDEQDLKAEEKREKGSGIRGCYFWRNMLGIFRLLRTVPVSAKGRHGGMAGVFKAAFCGADPDQPGVPHRRKSLYPRFPEQKGQDRSSDLYVCRDLIVSVYVFCGDPAFQCRDGDGASVSVSYYRPATGMF